MRCIFPGKIHHALVSTRSQGVMVGILEAVTRTLRSLDLDKDARYIIEIGILLSHMGVYAQNIQQREFWKQLYVKLATSVDKNIILGGK